jgi:hypothetical protein
LYQGTTLQAAENVTACANEGHGFSRAINTVCDGRGLQPLGYGFQDIQAEMNPFWQPKQHRVAFDNEPLHSRTPKANARCGEVALISPRPNWHG